MGRMKAKVKGRGARKQARRSAAAAQSAIGLKTDAVLERVRDTHLDERAAELADRARRRVRDAHLDERAAQLAGRVRESDAAQRAAAATRRASDQALERAGDWIATSGAGERLGVERTRRRRPVLLYLLLGVGLGYLAAWLMKRRSESQQAEDAFTESADWLSTPATPPSGPAPAATPSIAPDPDSALATSGDVEMPVVSGPLDDDGQPLEEEVRSTLHSDPRTSDLEDLSVNVAEGTVFIRGSIPSGVDSEDIREVVSGVRGVTDVDLQVTPA